MPFDIAIVGAGISGLAAAIGLSRDGYIVNVYERRPNTQQASGSGLLFQPSAIKILDRWGLLDGFKKVAHPSGRINLSRYADGSLVAVQKREGPRGQWYVLRNALRHHLFEAAVACGANIHFNTSVTSVNVDTPSIGLSDGTTVAADFIIAADGTNSMIRKTMYPGSNAIYLDTYTFQANIPRGAMYKEPSTVNLYEDPSTQFCMGQNSFSFSSVCPNQSIYDVQIVLRDFGSSGRDPHPEKPLQILSDLSIVGDSIDTWGPKYRQIVSKTTQGFFKWRNSIAPPIPSALAKSRNVILIGDACHAIDPSAGFGSALSLEDGLRLSLFISKARSLSEIPELLSIFDRTTRDRAKAVGDFSAHMGVLLSLPDGPMQRKRDEAMAKFDPNSMLGVKGDRRARYHTPEWQAYLDDWDCEIVVHEAIENPVHGL